MKTDFTPFLQGSLAGSAAMGQGIANMGEDIGGIFADKAEAKKAESSGTAKIKAFMELSNSEEIQKVGQGLLDDIAKEDSLSKRAAMASGAADFLKMGTDKMDRDLLSQSIFFDQDYKTKVLGVEQQKAGIATDAARGESDAMQTFVELPYAQRAVPVEEPRQAENLDFMAPHLADYAAAEGGFLGMGKLAAMAELQKAYEAGPQTTRSSWGESEAFVQPPSSDIYGGRGVLPPKGQSPAYEAAFKGKMAELQVKEPGFGQINWKAADDLRKEIAADPRIKDFDKVDAAYNKIEAAAKSSSAAGDLSLIFSYMKILDPGSTVREGEFSNAQNSAGVAGRVRNIYNNLLSGERLNDDQRKSFLVEARKAAKAQYKTVRPMLEDFRKKEGERGLPLGSVVPQYRLDYDFGPGGSSGEGKGGAGRSISDRDLLNQLNPAR